MNSITCRGFTLPELVVACKENNVKWIAPWRNIIADFGLEKSVDLIKSSGLNVSSLCRGGMFTSTSKEERSLAIEDNFRAIDEAAQLRAPTLVIVSGPVVDKNVIESQKMVEFGLSSILDYAESKNVDLALEPMHPMMAASRSCVTTLKQSLDILERINHQRLKVVIDVYHLWSDPDLTLQSERLKNRIAGFHISDWITPIENELASRGMPGSGCINLHALKDWVEDCGWTGPVEVEVISDYWTAKGPSKAFMAAIDSYTQLGWS
jgi:sugar phosphate isomerase/epimerase